MVVKLWKFKRIFVFQRCQSHSFDAQITYDAGDQYFQWNQELWSAAAHCLGPLGAHGRLWDHCGYYWWEDGPLWLISLLEDAPAELDPRRNDICNRIWSDFVPCKTGMAEGLILDLTFKIKFHFISQEKWFQLRLSFYLSYKRLWFLFIFVWCLVFTPAGGSLGFSSSLSIAGFTRC